MDLYCFGDSFTLGEYDAERGGWVDRLKTEGMARFLSEGDPGVCVFNLGIGGDTTQGMRTRLKAELLTRLDKSARSLVILAFGAVDAAEGDGRFVVPLEEYVENLSWAVDELRLLGCEVWLVNLTPVAPGADGIRNPSGRVRSNAVVAQYNDALAALSVRKSVGLLDVHGAFRGHEPTSMFAPDGVHPNPVGHALIAELVQKRLFPGRIGSRAPVGPPP